MILRINTSTFTYQSKTKKAKSKQYVVIIIDTKHNILYNKRVIVPLRCKTPELACTGIDGLLLFDFQPLELCI